MMVEFTKENFKAEAKRMKLLAIESLSGADLPPVVMVEKGNKILAVVVAPQVNKHAGLHAARLAHLGFNADSLLVILDARMKVFNKDAANAFEKKYSSGDLQKLVEEGNRGEIQDVLLCHRISKDGKYATMFLPYEYDKQNGINWLDTEALDFAEAELTGLIPEALDQIIKEQNVFNQTELFDKLKLLSNTLQIPEKNREYHVGRAILKILNEQGFMVFDLQEPPEGVVHEPIVPIKRGFVIGQIIPQKVINLLVPILSNPDKEVVRKDIIEILLPFRSEILENAKKFSVPLKNVEMHLLADAILASSKKQEETNTVRKLPYKVKVTFSDNDRTYVRFGNYTEDVELFYAKMPNGDIQPLANGEIPLLSDEQNKAGAEICSFGFNPKLVMQNGEILYGHQVEWEEVK